MATVDNRKLVEVAVRIREMREILEWSVADMAEKTGVSVAEYQLYETGTVDFICTDMPTAMGAVAKNDDFVILNFSGTAGDFRFASEQERAENVNIGISVLKGNEELTKAINRALSILDEEDFNAMMDYAIAIQPEL